MSGKVKQKSSATAADSSTQSINEKILKECHTLYIDPDNGELIFSYIARGDGLNITRAISQGHGPVNFRHFIHL